MKNKIELDTVRNKNLPLIHRYAEVWLNEAVELLRPRFNAAGYEIPPVYVSVGFSFCGHRPSSKKKTLAMCHVRRLTKDGINEIYISPFVVEPVEVLSILVHELIHAVDDCKSMHGEAFQEMARALKCADCLAVELEDWRETVNVYARMALQLGRYPRGGVRYRDSWDCLYSDPEPQAHHPVSGPGGRSASV